MPERPGLRVITRALALAAFVPGVLLLLRMPFHTPLFGIGLILLLPRIPLPTSPVIPVVIAAILFSWLLVFAALCATALPICLLLRKTGLRGFWPFGLLGILTGLLLAFWSSATPYDPRLIEWMQHVGASLRLRALIDQTVSFLQGFLMWMVIWRVGFRSKSTSGQVKAQGINTRRFIVAALILSALWLPILLAMPSHRDFISRFRFPVTEMLFPIDTLVLLCLAGLMVAWLFRRPIVGADRVRSIILGCVLPFFGTLVFLVLQMTYLILLAPFLSPGFEYESTPFLVYYGFQLTFLQFPIVALVGVGIQFALRWAGRAGT